MSEYYPNELILRPFYDNDIALFKEWVETDHVKPWYEHPEDWLHELNNRDGEFSFITHLIAEVDGISIGFCQYYDMFCGQKYDDRLNISTPGEIYSIDYLIGEPEYLNKGYGRKMVALMLDMLRKKAVKKVVVRPDADNFKSNRVLEANNFVWNGTDYILEL